MRKNRFDQEGRVAIVTGAGQGIGAAIAEVIVEHGATVVLADLNQKNLAHQVERIKGNGALMEEIS